MKSGSRHTPEAIISRLQADLAALPPAERERCQRMILCEVVASTHGGKVLEIATVVAQQEETIRAEHDKNSRRSRREDKQRNDQIRLARRKGKTIGEIAKKHKVSIAAVNGVLNRDKQKQRALK